MKLTKVFLSAFLFVIGFSTVRASGGIRSSAIEDVEPPDADPIDLFALTGGECCLGEPEEEDDDGGARRLVVATQYHVLFYGSKVGYGNNRAQITLRNSSGVVAYLRFKDDNMSWPNDSQSSSSGIIAMHIPMSAFSDVMDLIKSAPSINVYFAQGRGFLNANWQQI